MNTPNDGGPAFPVSTGMGPLSANFVAPGMSLRDWFAGKCEVWRDSGGAMLGFSNSTLATITDIVFPSTGDTIAHVKWEIQVEARLKYMYADTMLTERNRSKP